MLTWEVDLLHLSTMSRVWLSLLPPSLLTLPSLLASSDLSRAGPCTAQSLDHKHVHLMKPAFFIKSP